MILRLTEGEASSMMIAVQKSESKLTPHEREVLTLVHVSLGAAWGAASGGRYGELELFGYEVPCLAWVLNEYNPQLLERFPALQKAASAHGLCKAAKELQSLRDDLVCAEMDVERMKDELLRGTKKYHELCAEHDRRSGEQMALTERRWENTLSLDGGNQTISIIRNENLGIEIEIWEARVTKEVAARFYLPKEEAKRFKALLDVMTE